MSETYDGAVNEQAVLDIIKAKNVHTYFQPVISVPTKSIVGFEAFSRGGGGDVCVIDPKMLFHNDLSPELKIDVDRLCREKAFEQFKPIHANHKQMLLFVNIDVNILPHVEIGSEVLKNQIASMGIIPENVVLECPLNCIDVQNVLEFSVMYRELGFKICLDNCCVDDSFSQAMSIMKPDFVKACRTFFAEGERKDYSTKALEALISVADKNGAMVIGQGVECEDDSIRLLTSGVHLQQGYYYTKDEDATTGDPAKMFFQKIIATYDKYKKVKQELVRRKKERFSNTFKTVTSICSKFSNMPEDRFEDACKTLVYNTDAVISMFVLNSEGVQITPRSHVRLTGGKQVAANLLGSDVGVDHSVRDYVLYLDMGYEKFVTTPFSSPFTGENACIISKPFYNKEGQRYVVCIELPHPG